MKHAFYIALGMLLAVHAAYAMDAKSHKILLSLAHIKEKADQGDIVSSMALHYFFKKVRTPTYPITEENCKKVLIEHRLLNAQGEIQLPSSL